MSSAGPTTAHYPDAFDTLDESPELAYRMRCWVEERTGRYVELRQAGIDNRIRYRVAHKGVIPEMLDHDRPNDDPVWSGCINVYEGGNSTVGGDVPNLTRYDVQAYLRALVEPSAPKQDQSKQDQLL